MFSFKDAEYQDRYPDSTLRCHRCDHYGWGGQDGHPNAPWCNWLKKTIGALGHCKFWVKMEDITKVKDA